MPYNGEGSYVAIEELLDAEGYKEEFEYGYGGYDWHIYKVFSKDGRFFVLQDGGCSCSSYGDSWSDAQSAIGDMNEVTKLPTLEELASDYGTEYWDEKVETVQQRFRDLGLR